MIILLSRNQRKDNSRPEQVDEMSSNVERVLKKHQEG